MNNSELESPVQTAGIREFESFPELAEAMTALTSANPAAIEESSEKIAEFAKGHPELIPFLTRDLSKLLGHARTGVRLTSLETLNIVAKVAPGTVAFLLPRLHDLLSTEPIEAVRDKTLDVLTTYARSSGQAAARVFPMLLETVDKYGTKNAMKAFNSMAAIVQFVPKFSKEAIAVADSFQSSVIESVRVAAMKLRNSVK